MIRTGYRAARRHERCARHPYEHAEPRLEVRGTHVVAGEGRVGGKDPRPAGARAAEHSPRPAVSQEVASPEGLALQNYRLGPDLAILFVRQPAGCLADAPAGVSYRHTKELLHGGSPPPEAPRQGR